MAKGKRESIVPGLGKKQAAVLNNEAGRQAEHKRHLDELGFPEYVEPDFVRHAPVSYDDPSNPSPSRIVNQAGQDLGATNDPLLSKSLAEMVDIQAIVKEAASEVFVSKDENEPFDPKKVIPVSELGYGGKRLGTGGNAILDTFKFILFGGKGRTSEVADLDYFYDLSGDRRPRLPLEIAVQSFPVAIFDAFNLAGESSRDDVQEIQRISRIPNENRRAEERDNLKNALDRQYSKKFGIKYTADGNYSPELTKFATIADMKIYFDILNGFSEDPIEQNEADAFVDNFGFTDEEIKRVEGIDAKFARVLKNSWDALKSEVIGGSEKANIPYDRFEKWAEENASDTLKTQYQRSEEAGTEQALQELNAGTMNIDTIGETLGGYGEKGKDFLNQVIDYGGEKIKEGIQAAEEFGTDFSEGFKGIDPLKNFPESRRSGGLDKQPTSTAYDAGKEFKNVSNDFKAALENFRETQGKKLKDLFDSAVNNTSTLQTKLTDAGFGRGLSSEGIKDLATKLNASGITNKVSSSAVNDALGNVKNVLNDLVDQGKLLYDKATDRYQNIEGAKPEEIKEIQDNFKTPASPTQAQLQTDPSFEYDGATRTPTTFGRTQAELDVIARNKALKDKAIKEGDTQTLADKFGMGPAYRGNPKTGTGLIPAPTTLAIQKYNAWLQKAEEEGAMAKVQLDRVSDLADMLHDILEDEDELPGWIQNKISDSLHNLEASFTNLAYDEKEELGLRKTIDTFKDFLAQAPSQGGFLKKNAARVIQLLGRILKITGDVAETGAVGGTAAFATPLKDRIQREAVIFGLDKVGPSQKEQEDDLRRELAIMYSGGQQFYDDMTRRQKADARAAVDDTLVTNTLKLFKEIYKNPDYYFDSRNEELIDSVRQGLNPYLTPTSDTGIPTPGGESKDRGGAAPPVSEVDDPDMSVPDFVQPTSTIKPVGVREATVSELAARDEAGYRGTSTNPFELPVVGSGEKEMASNLDNFVNNLNIASDLQRAASLKNLKPLPKVASGVGYMKDGKSYDEFGRRTTAPVESALREITIVDDKGKKGTSVVSDAQIIPGSYDPAVVQDVFGGSKSAANSYFGIQAAIIKELVNDFIQKAKKKKGGRKKDPRLARAGVAGFNKPKRTPKHPTKSHIVVAKEGDKIKTIRYGQQGAKTAGDPKKGESAKMKKKRKSFKARHRKNIKRGKMSAAYWADKSKW